MATESTSAPVTQNKRPAAGPTTGCDDDHDELGDGAFPKRHDGRQLRLTSKTVFVTGLAPGLARIHLEKLFQKFGTVERLDIKTGKTNLASRYCFCEFDTLESAQNAMDNLNGRMLLHKRLVVQPAHDRDSSAPHSGSLSSSSSSMSAVKEGRLLDKKIEELKRKINAAKK
jgi:RNA recognition motif-containing protein